MSGFGYNINGFGSFPSRGYSGPVLAWANNNSRPYIATGSSMYVYFAVPINDPTISPNQWEYSNNGGASWGSFSQSAIIVTPTTPLVFNGTTYFHYAKSPAWSAGNNSYIQRFGGGTLFSGATSLGETIAIANNSGNYF